jgi:hypothetical protein
MLIGVKKGYKEIISNDPTIINSLRPPSPSSKGFSNNLTK